jgi:hypothetical protein
MSPEMIAKDWPGRITISDPVGLINEIARIGESISNIKKRLKLNVS